MNPYDNAYRACANHCRTELSALAAEVEHIANRRAYIKRRKRALNSLIKMLTKLLEVREDGVPK